MAEPFEASFATLFEPVEPWNRWPVLTPLVSIAGAAVVVALSGVALVAFAAMSAAVFAVVFLLSEVFGYELAMPAMGAAGRYSPGR